MKNIEQAFLEEKAARLKAEHLLAQRTQEWQTILKELETLKQTTIDEGTQESAGLGSIALFAVQYPEPLIRINYAGEVLVKNVSATRINSLFFHNRTYTLRDFLKLVATVVRRKKTEWTLEAESGSILYSFHCRPHPKNDYINIYGKDITAERKAQEEMQRLSLVASANANGVIFTDAKGKIFWANEGFAKLTGHATPAVYGQTLAELCNGPIIANTTLQQITTLLHTGQLFCIDAMLYRNDGSFFWGRCSGQPIREEGTKSLQYFLVIENITFEKEQEEKLRRREEKYRSIIANMHLGLVEFDLNGHACFVNNSFCDMTGYEPGELIGKDIIALLATEEYMVKLKEELLNSQKGISTSYEGSIRNKNREVRWWLLCGAPLYNDEGKLVGSIAVSLDITAQKELENQLRESKKEAEHSARAKEVFLANMSHEIRTPMNAVLGMSKLLQKTALKKEQQFYANTIQKAAGNLLVIINDILDFSKIEAGKIGLETIGFDIKELLQQAMFSMAHKAEEKGLSINLYVDERVNKILIGDPFRINQILMNLLSNAIKFTEKGSVQINCLIDDDGNTEQTLLLQVIDSGVGIDEEFQRHLFEKFTQEDGSVARRYGGTGLGMSICKQLTEMMNGSIKVFSRKNMGTTISLSFTLGKGNSHDLKVAEKRSINTNLLKNKEILLAEDNELNRLVVKAVLQNYGVRITEAFNGLEAINKLQNCHFDLVLMDVQMPEMDGLEATRMIRSKVNKNIPIIALTANAIQGELDRCIGAGMNGYLSKPFEEDDLLYLVTKWLGKDSSFDMPMEENIEDSPLYDLSRLQAISRGDNDFINKMCSIFIKEIPPTIASISMANQQGDLVQVKSLAHRIKATFDNMGMVLLSENIRQIENLAANETSISDLGLLINKMEKTVQMVIKQLEQETKEAEIIL